MELLRGIKALVLIRSLGVRNTLILVLLIGSGIVGYELLFAPKFPPYTRPAGYAVTATCATGGRDCDENGFVRLWGDSSKGSSSYVRSPDAPFCVATTSSIATGRTFWWIDCGLWQGLRLPIIEGWVQQENLIFGEWIEARKIH